jgi:AcrR family transcriptional regulator
VHSPRANSHRRATPRQARSKKTVERILESAIEVLDEHGLQAFNTNLVSQVAGVNGATLYHYFPDKNSILLELIERSEQDRTEFLGSHLRAVRGADDLSDWAGQMGAAVREWRRRQPASTVLRRSCRAVPELLVVEQTANEQAAEVLRDGLCDRFPHLSRQRAHAASRTIVQMTSALIDYTTDHPRSSAAMVSEFESLLRVYLHAMGTEAGNQR